MFPPARAYKQVTQAGEALWALRPYRPVVRVLIIEDDSASLDLVTRIVQHMGHSVTTADNGREGIRCALAQSPDVILLDQHLPDVPGWMVAAELRAQEAFARTPIVAVSAGTTDDRARALDAGCSDFIAKPYDLAELRAAIEFHCQRVEERTLKRTLTSRQP
jgi:two-component system cell cycle response regulator DivK